MATAGSAERPVRVAGGPGARGDRGVESGARGDRGDRRGEPGARGDRGDRGAEPGGTGVEERGRSSSAAERSGGRRGREFFIIPKCSDVSSAPAGKHKLLLSEDREDGKRRNILEASHRDEEPGVLSDSENEEPISRRIRNISAFIKKTKNCAAFTGVSQRSQSCTDPVEDPGGKLKGLNQPLIDRVGLSHSSPAGILLSSENSRSASAPTIAPERRLTWRPVVSSSTPLVPPPPRPERSISPESNDSISEELNHFKPIVCSPCTPPKRLADGRLLEPTIVKSTPRNLTRGLQKATSYEASPAVLQKWRQIELDRQSAKVNSKATLTSPVNEQPGRGGVWDDGATRNHLTHTDAAINKRRLLFEASASDSESIHKQVKIRVPALRCSRSSTESEALLGAPESGSGTGLFSRKQSFSPYRNSSGFQACRFVPKDSESPRKEAESLLLQSTSCRGKREQKTKHLDAQRDVDRRRSHSGGGEDERCSGRRQQERRDRALALRLQRQFDLENQSASRRHSPDTYFLRSWRSNQNRRRRGLRRSRRISKKH